MVKEYIIIIITVLLFCSKVVPNLYDSLSSVEHKIYFVLFCFVENESPNVCFVVVCLFCFDENESPT